MPAPIIPWEIHTFPIELQEEFDRRKTNRGMEYVKATDGDWRSLSGEDWLDYKGPMSPWVRFCSNGAGRINPYEGSEYYDKQGFILSGGKEFYSSYGFSNIGQYGQSTNEYGIIGYMPDGSHHIIDNDIKTSNYPIHVPPPEIERISVTIQKELYRRASIEWVCFSAKQLEYMTPYFLVPGITCILEWGWNHFDPSSLIDLTDIPSLKQLKKNPYKLYTDHILSSHGNYDVLLGVVTMFEWSIDGNKIRCKTEITSPDRLYAGLSIQSNITSNVSPEDKSKPNASKNVEAQNIQIETSLKSLVTQFLPKIREISNVDVSNDADITLKFGKEDDSDFRDFIRYVKLNNPIKYSEILYGVYYGKDVSKHINVFPDKFTENVGGFAIPRVRDKVSNPNVNNIEPDPSNKDKDFYIASNENVWINVGLLIEILNYKCDSLKFFDNDAIFKIDINDCVIGGHQNLISTNGDHVLIPNANAPKYFYGTYESHQKTPSVIDETNTITKVKNNVKAMFDFGPVTEENTFDSSVELDYDILKTASHTIPLRYKTKKELIENGQAADYRVYSTCIQFGRVVKRDDLDSIINELRYSKLPSEEDSFEFPFFNPQYSGNPDTRSYPANISGYLKNIYFSIVKLGDICKDPQVKTFSDVINKVLETISTSCGNFWDFRLVNSTGQLNNQGEKSASTMKIVDYRFVSSINSGKVYTFDWFDADSLLQSVKFTPTISSAQTIRTMYAATNNPQNRTIISGQNELLDYHFKDRLLLGDQTKYETPKPRTSSTHISMMKTLQNISPPPKSFQVTTAGLNGKPLVRRLAIPPEYSELLTLLLDDEDLENNPRYTGIMPGIQAQFTIQGIGGLRTFMMFLVRNFPEPYSHENIVFRVIDLTETIEGGKWTTVITAGIMPLRKQLKDRLGITPK